MEKLEAKIGYRFKNRDLLCTALTHSSYANERHDPACQSYERLEFLGDSILGLTAAEFLYAHEPKLPEGRMTRLRAELVFETSLHKVALRLELGKYMRLGRGRNTPAEGSVPLSWRIWWRPSLPPCTWTAAWSSAAALWRK